MADRAKILEVKIGSQFNIFILKKKTKNCGKLFQKGWLRRAIATQLKLNLCAKTITQHRLQTLLGCLEMAVVNECIPVLSSCSLLPVGYECSVVKGLNLML